MGDSKINVIDHTNAYNGKAIYRYIEKALTFIPEEDLKGINIINIYDEVFMNSPVIAQGGYYPLTTDKETEIDLYLDQNYGHMLSLHKKRNTLTTFFDGLFVHTVGKLFIVHTLYHEIGHHIYDTRISVDDTDDNASEEYADEYAHRFYGKAYPLAQKYYGFLNKLYHLIYERRIANDNEIREQKKV